MCQLSVIIPLVRNVTAPASLALEMQIVTAHRAVRLPRPVFTC